MEQRLQLFLQMEQLSQSQFADKIGIQRSGVTHLLSGRNKPSFDFITRILRAYPTLNAEWLILGKGKPYKDASTAAPETVAAEPEEASVSTGLFTSDPEPEYADSTEIDTLSDTFQLEDKEDNKSINKPIDTPKVIKAILILYEDGTYEKR